jgi:hypothetical protein
MHLPTHAGARRRTRRARLAAALSVVVAAFALPAAAHAATTVELSGGTLTYRADTEKTNTVAVRDLAGAVEVRDLRGVTARGAVCVNVDPLTVRCGVGTQRLQAFLGDRNDSITVRASFPAVVDGGSGDDAYIGAFGPERTRVRFIGGVGRDAADYVNSDRGVRLSNDGVANDGRSAFDQDDIGGDVEHLTGSRFGDEITAQGGESEFCCHQVINGGRGDDVLRDAGGTSKSFQMGRTADGADTIIAGAGSSTLDYSQRTQPVTVTVNDGGADDGEAGERDEVFGSHEFIFGGSAGDTLRAPANSTAKHELFGSEGDDTLEGADGPDNLNPGPGADTVLANGGNDLVFAGDLSSDVVACGTGIDAAVLDSNDGFSSCENRHVGVLRLTPGVQRADAGETARMKLSWRHPDGWKQLKTIQLRLSQQGMPVGEITIRPQAERITADGAIQLVGKRTRLTSKGKTVTARLAVRLDPSLAGQTLEAEVEATDTRGHRQLERDAGTIRVAR